MPSTRVAEVFAALSLTTDLASGVPVEKGLRTCVVATAFADVLGLGEADRSAVFHAALLRAVGCTAFAPENAAHFGDDIVFQAVLKRLDPGDPAVFGAQLSQFGAWAGPRRGELARHFTAIAPTEGPRRGGGLRGQPRPRRTARAAGGGRGGARRRLRTVGRARHPGRAAG